MARYGDILKSESGWEVPSKKKKNLLPNIFEFSFFGTLASAVFLVDAFDMDCIYTGKKKKKGPH